MLDAGRIRPGMLELAALSDYLVAGEQFFLDLNWKGDDATFAGLASKIGAAVVTVTMGARGSLTWHHGQVFHQQAFPVEVLDTTGAGDVFHGAYIYGILQGWQLKDIVAFASAVAAMKCRKVGGRTGIPTLGEALAFLTEQTGRGVGRR
jgi:ribokinase